MHYFLRSTQVLLSLAALVSGSWLAAAQDDAPARRRRDAAPDLPPPIDVNDAVNKGMAVLLSGQEGEAHDQWPYEGVYRVGGEIPVGYRVGGTGIVITALLQAPGFAEDASRLEAVKRGAEFICSSISHPLMAHEFESTYDVRGWGYAYGAWGLLALHDATEGKCLGIEVAPAMKFFLDGIAATEIPGGGWNYARRGGFQAPGAMSPFMTGSTLQMLFAAQKKGYAFDPGLVQRGLDALEKGRTPTGSYMYAGSEGEKSRESVPGSVGRMLVAESTLHLAGRSNVERVRGALDAFIVHWEWLEKRRRQSGTHVAPYGVAPYYFYYAHYFAAQAIQRLPGHEQAEYTRRLHELIARTRDEKGAWNDRVFERSQCYGTAMIVQALLMPKIGGAPEWTAAPATE